LTHRLNKAAIGLSAKLSPHSRLMIVAREPVCRNFKGCEFGSFAQSANRARSLAKKWGEYWGAFVQTSCTRTLAVTCRARRTNECTHHVRSAPCVLDRTKGYWPIDAHNLFSKRFYSAARPLKLVQLVPRKTQTEVTCTAAHHMVCRVVLSASMYIRMFRTAPPRCEDTGVLVKSDRLELKLLHATVRRLRSS
jgi:hypothetical protein